MEKKQLWYPFGITLIVLAAIGGFFLYSSLNPVQSPSQTSETRTVAVSLTIQGLSGNDVFAVASGTTLLSFLQNLNAHDPKIQLETKDYSSLGTLVTGIGGMKNGTNNAYWQYKVNGVMPQVGADVYVLKNGDKVEWYFAPSQE